MYFISKQIPKEYKNISNKELSDIIDSKVKRGILHNNNKKLGKAIYDFNLPPIDSCPNCLDCQDTCYAVNSYNRYPSAKKCWKDNFKLVVNDLPRFKTLVNNQIKKDGIYNIRIHSSGDFYNIDYLMAWIDIINNNANIMFYAYTKAFEGFKDLPKNLNIIDSYVTHNNKKYLNYGSYKYISKLRTKSKGIICPITIGKKLNCFECKYCFTKKKVLFIEHN